MNRVNRQLYIRKIFAALLLCIFALSVTPTRYLHQLFANHKDFISKTNPGPRPQLNVAGINCHCETNVVIAPYTVQPSPLITQQLPVFKDFTFSDGETPVFSGLFSFGLRGPPQEA